MRIAYYEWENPVTRTYHWPDGSIKMFFEIVSLGVAHTGCHTITDKDGKVYVVAPGWRWIEHD